MHLSYLTDTLKLLSPFAILIAFMALATYLPKLVHGLRAAWKWRREPAMYFACQKSELMQEGDILVGPVSHTRAIWLAIGFLQRWPYGVVLFASPKMATDLLARYPAKPHHPPEFTLRGVPAVELPIKFID